MGKVLCAHAINKKFACTNQAEVSKNENWRHPTAAVWDEALCSLKKAATLAAEL